MQKCMSFKLFHLYLLASLLVNSQILEFRCLDGQFLCSKSKTCINNHLVNNGFSDCADGEDEMKCGEDEFKCNSGKCISRTKLCDSFDNCGDNLDEDPSVCFKEKCPGSFLCGILLDQCVEKCTKTPKCLDFTDISSSVCSNFQPKIEVDCNEEEFKCLTEEKCIPSYLKCNGKADCLDGSDEKVCEKIEISGDELKCLDGEKIPSSWKCNGIKDCSQGEDEELDCLSSLDFPVKNYGCGSNKFLCISSEGQECLDRSHLCDGIDDCLDASDEVDETCHNKNTCSPDKFMCRGVENHCIEMSKVCDGFQDCPRGDDESSNSRTKCMKKSCDIENGGCKHICQLGTANSVKCTCHKGYILKSDQRSCEAGSDASILFIVNGQIFEGRLPDMNSLNRLTFIEKEDANLSDFSEAKAMWMSPKKEELLMRVNQELGNNRFIAGHSLVQGQNSEYEDDQHWTDIVDFDYSYQLESRSGAVINKFLENVPNYNHPDGLNLVWSQNNRDFPGIFMIHDQMYDDSHNKFFLDKKVKVKPLSVPMIRAQPSDIEKIAMTALENHNSSTSTKNPKSLAYDWVHGNVYWTNSNDRTISVVNLISGWRKVLFTLRANHFANSLVVDPRFGYLYWIETILGSVCNIKIASMDGEIQRIFLANTGDVSEIHIDYLENEMYVEKSLLGKIEVYSLTDGQRRRIILDNDSIRPRSINIFEDSVYFTNSMERSLLQIDKYSGVMIREIDHFPSAVFRIQHKVLRPSWLNRCFGNPCSHICLPSSMQSYPNLKTPYICSCPEFWELTPDQITCQPIKNLAFILKSSSNPEDYFRISASYSNTKMFDHLLQQYNILFGEKNHDPYLTGILVLLSIVMVCFFGVGLACIAHHAVKQKLRKSNTVNLLNDQSNVRRDTSSSINATNNIQYYPLPIIPENHRAGDIDDVSLSAFVQDSSHLSMLIDPADLPIETTLVYHSQ